MLNQVPQSHPIPPLASHLTPPTHAQRGALILFTSKEGEGAFGCGLAPSLVGFPCFGFRALHPSPQPQRGGVGYGMPPAAAAAAGCNPSPPFPFFLCTNVRRRQPLRTPPMKNPSARAGGRVPSLGCSSCMRACVRACVRVCGRVPYERASSSKLARSRVCVCVRACVSA